MDICQFLNKMADGVMMEIGAVAVHPPKCLLASVFRQFSWSEVAMAVRYCHRVGYWMLTS